MKSPTTFAGVTGKKIGDGIPGPETTETTETVEVAESTESTETSEATEFGAEEVAEEVINPAPESEPEPAADEPEPEPEPEPADSSVIFSSHPIQRLSLGKYDFVNGQLLVDSADVAEFEQMLEQQPPAIRYGIKKIDRASANRLAQSILGSRQIVGIDTTASSLDAPNVQPFSS